MAKRGVNSITIIGTMGQDPKVHQAGSSSFTSVSLATSESWIDKQTGAKIEETEWHRVVLKGWHGELVAQHGRKGRELYVLGKLKTRKYTTNGVEKSVTEIIVDAFDGQCRFIDSTGVQAAASAQSPGQSPQQRQQAYAARQPAQRPQAPARSYDSHDDLTPPPQMMDIPDFDENFVKNIPV